MRRRIMASIGVGAKNRPTARDYVQDGLTHMWDGIENAGWGVHDDTTLTWYDLIGLVNPTIKSGLNTWGSCYSKLENSKSNRMNWYAATNISPVFIEAVFMVDGNPAGGVNGIVSAGANSSVRKPELMIVSAKGTLCFGGDNGRTTDISDRYGEIISASFRCLNDGKWYVDGVLQSVATGTQATNGSNVYLQIGSAWNGLNGKIYCVRTYGRTLSAEEVAANYAIDKVRFGIA